MENTDMLYSALSATLRCIVDQGNIKYKIDDIIRIVRMGACRSFILN